MVEKIFFLNEIDDDIIVKEKIDSESKIFCFDIKSHYYLEKNDLSHVLAEDYLSEKEKEEVFTLAVDLWKWYEKDEVFKKLNIEKVNYFSILDTSEFHQLIIDKIKYFAMIKEVENIGIRINHSLQIKYFGNFLYLFAMAVSFSKEYFLLPR